MVKSWSAGERSIVVTDVPEIRRAPIAYELPLTSLLMSTTESSPLRVEVVVFVDEHPSQEKVLLSITNTVKDKLARLGASSVSFATSESSGLDPLKSSSKQLTISVTLQPSWSWESE